MFKPYQKKQTKKERQLKKREQKALKKKALKVSTHMTNILPKKRKIIEDELEHVDNFAE
jgi:hypothetical protein